MTTTEKRGSSFETRPCGKCGKPATNIEGTEVWNCNACGWTGGEVKSQPQPETDVPRATIGDPVQPDEVIGAGEKSTQSTEPEPPPSIDHNAVLEQAVESAMSMPGVPGRDEFLTLAQTARMLAMSPLVPKFLRGNPAACFHMAMIGRDLGISPTSAVELIDIMPDDKNDPSKGGRPMLSPELLNAQVIRLGLGSIAPLCKTPMRCVAVALSPGGALDRTCVRIGRHFYGTKQDFIDLGYIEDGDQMSDVPPHALSLPLCQCHGIVGETEFEWSDAVIAGLAGTQCVPGNHHKVTKNGRNGSTYERCDCAQGYITYPKQMMWWRASGFCQTENFPQASVGLYTAEAMGALVDTDGRMIDPLTVALPEGFEPEPPKAPDASDPDFRPPAEVWEVANVMGRINDLPPEQQTSLKAMWTEKQREHRIEPVARLTTIGMRVALALLDTAEREARAKGWEPTYVPLTAPGSSEPPVEEGSTPEGQESPGETSTGSPPDPQEPAQEVTEPVSEGSVPPEGVQDDPGPLPGVPEGMAPDLAVQWGRKTPVLTIPLVEASMTIVGAMTSRAVNDALRKRGMSDKDDKDVRYRNLARAMAQEAAEQDWAAAKGGVS